MTEAVTANAGTDKTQAAAQGAQSGEDGPTIAELIAKADTTLQAKKPEPETKSESAPTTTKTEAAPDSRQVAAQVRAEIRAEENLNALVRRVAEVSGLPQERARSLVTGELTGKTPLAQAWIRSYVDPNLWGQATELWVKEVGAEFKGAAKKVAEPSSDRAAVRAGASLSPSAEAPPEKKRDIRGDAAAYAAFLKEHGIRHG